MNDSVLVGEELGHLTGFEFEVGGAGEGFLLGGDECVHRVGSGRDFEATGRGVAEEAFEVGGLGGTGAFVVELDGGELFDEAVLVVGGGAELGAQIVDELVVVLGGFEEEAGGVFGEAAVLEGVER
jgi:hypothetical protein